MTDQPATPHPATRPNDSSHRTTPHSHATDAERSSPTRLKINNFSAHPRITIRWIQDAGQIRQAALILK